MKTKLRIAIRKPCQEKYSSFTTTPNGGFCPSCQKEVIDFTSWSDERIKSYFKNLKGNSCGRFRQDQLREYSDGNPSRKGMGWITFLFAGFLLLFSSRQVSAQSTPRQTTEQYQPEEKNESIKRTKRAMITVIGTVRSRDDGETMPGVNVTSKGALTGTTTDAEGKFKLDLPYSDSLQIITFSFIGFQPIDYMHNTKRPEQEIDVGMVTEVMDVNDLIMVGGVQARRWYDPREIASDVWWWLTGR